MTDTNIERINWVRSLPFVIAHVAAVVGVVMVGISPWLVALAAGSYALRMWAITAGYHRYFSHRSFKTSRAFQFILALVGSLAAQKGALWWAANHRDHHRHSDQEEDIHSPTLKGFFWSHVGWILSNKHHEVDYRKVKDLGRYPELVWLDRHYLVAPLTAAGLVWAFFGGAVFVWVALVATVALWHGTFTINSLCHVFGRRRFETTDTSKNSLILALITLGEGWHNNHHYYPGSTRQGFYWWEVDLSYYSLVVLSWLGIVWDLNKVPERVLEKGRRGLAPSWPRRWAEPGRLATAGWRTREAVISLWPHATARFFRPVLALAALLAAGRLAAEPPAFKIYVQEPGVYRVSWEDLHAAGLPEEPTESRLLALENRGEPAPILVVDGDDGRFGPGDHVDFIGEHLQGVRSFYNDETPLNVYRLTTGNPGVQMRVPDQPAKLRGRVARDAFRVERHLEHDQLMVRFAVPRDQPLPETWYWAKLTQLEKDSFTTEIDLGDRDPKSKQPTSLRLELRGWSVPQRKTKGAPADHRVEVFWNDVLVGSGEWNRQDAHVIEIPRLPKKSLRPGPNTLRLVVPVRIAEGESDPLVDVALLNWIELAYPRQKQLDRAQARFEVSAHAAQRSA
ncbi:MAG: acyl-CoA desaturase, partial [Thermoanaerobaculia bacterium]|nr:acyl-CoA desaturase [Thermoanaerobaculia bacterium]